MSQVIRASTGQYRKNTCLGLIITHTHTIQAYHTTTRQEQFRPEILIEKITPWLHNVDTILQDFTLSVVMGGWCS